jgi:hypothetical protein
MKVLNLNWVREMECGYCGALLHIMYSDVKKWACTNFPPVAVDYVTYYISCPIMGCEKDTVITDLPVSIEQTARTES